MSLDWLFLVGAIVLEVMGTTSMKLSAGFTRPLPSVLLFVFYALSFTLFTLAVKRLEVSLAYAIWAGVGTMAITMIGITMFQEPVTLVKAGSILLIIVGVVGLNLSGAVHT